MKVIFKNSDLVFQQQQQLYCGIFTPSNTRVNTILKDGCGGENPLIEGNNGAFNICKSYTAQMVNATKLTYADVFEIPDIEQSGGGYYTQPFMVAYDLGTSAHQTIGFWIKKENLDNLCYIWLGSGSKSTPTFNPASENLRIRPTGDWNSTVETAAVGDTFKGAVTAFKVKFTQQTINSESWAFVEVHIDADQDFSTSLALMIGKAVGGSGNIGHKIITANWTHINDNVSLDAMTYYPAVGHNPQKDPTAS